MNKSLKIAIAAVVALAAAAWLAFGFFGIQAAFIDDEVSEANPFGDGATAPQAESETSAVVTAPAAPSAGASTESADGKQRGPDTSQAAAAPEPAQPANDAAASNPDLATNAEQPPTDAVETQSAATPQITTLATGSLVDHAHAGDGTVNVLTDGTQRFLRFEDDFAIDNGPDLNVYLVRGVDAEGPAGLFDDDFIDLGDLKGNIGAQNYELDSTIDLSEYDTVVIWCVRFGVAFNAANLT